jgi:hypothetical protein
LAAVTLVSGAMWWLERPGLRTGSRSPAQRLVWTACLGAALAAILLSFPGPRDGLEPALRFLTMTDEVGRKTGEQLPLFAFFGRPVGRPAWEIWGLFAYLIPLAPIAVVLVAAREKRAAAWALAAWCGFFGGLALVQRRYGNDLGPAVAVAFGFAIAAVARRAAAGFRIPSLTPLIACGIGLAMLAIPVWGGYRPMARSSIRALRGDFDGHDRATATVGGTLTRFMERVREVSPETSGYFDVSDLPEYGIVANANLGHALQNVAHRPTPTDPFWAFIGRENWDRSFALLGAGSEARALELAVQLRAGYVVTMSHADPTTLEGWLHHGDGLAWRNWPVSQRFRLVTEADPGGVPLTGLFRREGRPGFDRTRVPYKLFEIVAGAVVEARAEPGAEVSLTLAVESASGRSLDYEAKAVANSSGLARLRVPYATDEFGDEIRVVAPGRYQLRIADCTIAVPVSDAEVRTGAVVVVSASADACGGA